MKAKGTFLPHYLLFWGFLFVLFSCSTRREALESPTTIAVRPQDYLRQFTETRVEPIAWQGSGSLGVEVSGFSIDVRTDISFFPGYGFFFSFRPMLFAEVARIYILPDEVIVIDRYNERYFRASYDYLSEQISFSLSYSMIESLFLGEAVRPYEKVAFAEEGAVELHPLGAPIYLYYRLNDLIRPHRAMTMPLFKGVYATIDYASYSDRLPGALPTDINIQVFRQGYKQVGLHYVSRSLRRDITAADRLRPEIPVQYRELREDEITRLLSSLFQD
ncbi:DUF4292 domain-containing protein [Porphyromonas circumdentaria]|uniref:DUF4292 domain-containing protein n=1 Tax=Porphyromonas circumdentaria TaxID=29524 RepID=UPI0026DD13F8|nr:DUF4292 domain-containing protein [Porphyromonas circumdentaria]